MIRTERKIFDKMTNSSEKEQWVHLPWLLSEIKKLKRQHVKGLQAWTVLNKLEKKIKEDDDG